jgi:hypothetical protein
MLGRPTLYVIIFFSAFAQARDILFTRATSVYVLLSLLLQEQRRGAFP